MKCNFEVSPVGGVRCSECGGDLPVAEDRDCTAEVPFEHVLAMERGEKPRQAIKLTPYQTMRLSAERQNDHVLTPPERQRLFPDAPPVLLGSQLKKLLSELGVPPCAGCEDRAAWVDKAHALVRSWMA